MWDPDVLKKCGCSAEAWEKVFKRANAKAPYPAKIEKLVNLIRSRVQGGIDYNFTNHYLYHALDLAWDTPFQQLTPTLIQSFVDKPISSDDAEATLKSWGIDVADLWEEVRDPKTPDKTIRKLTAPSIVKVIPPLVKAYLTMRWAKIVNDMNLIPLDKFDPAISDELSMLKADALNHRVEVMNQQMGAFETRKSAIWRMLHYGECLAFPVEGWYTEEQIHGVDSKEEGKPFKNKAGEKVGKKVLVKEGIRHHLPHPTRTFYDRSHFPTGFNNGIGPKYAGYWRVVTYAEILDNKDLYNTENIAISTRDWNTTDANTYLTNVYKGCVMNFPACYVDPATGGVSKMDSEKHVGESFYQRDMRDKSILQTEYFDKLIPSEWGLGDYDCPVWARFVLASDNTVMYAEPVPFEAVIYYGYDNPGGRMLNASMTLEILPFQDQIGNILTQIYLSIRQNLTNLTMIDTDVLEPEMIQRLENNGEKWYRKLNFAFFSTMKARKGMQQPGQPIIAQRFPQLDVVSQYTALKVSLDMLERTLGMAPQELGQPASHEQTREEVKVIQGSSSTRLEFTKLGAEAAHQAHKKQNYEALMANGAESFYVVIPLNPKMDQSELEKLGFTVKSSDPTTGKALMKVDKTALMYESWIANRDGDDRVSDSQTAKDMLSVLQPVLESPAMQGPLAEAIGVDQTIKVLNYIGRKAGFPRDFKLTNIADQKAANAQVPPSTQQLVDGVAKHIEDDVKGALTHVGDQINGQAQQMATLSQQVQSIQGTLQNLLQTAQQAPPLPPPNALDTLQPRFSNPAGSGTQFDPMAASPGIPQPAQAI